jgi:hypothetical protein
MKAISSPPSTVHKANKVRLFDILTRVAEMGETSGTLITWQFDPLMEHELRRLSDRKDLLPGLTITFPYNEEEDVDRVPREVKLRIDSEDWEFESVENRLHLLDEEHRIEREREDKRNSVLRHMDHESRELLGYKSWKDPDPDGAARVLAEDIMKVKTRRKIKRA